MRLIDADELELDAEWSEYEDGYISYSQIQIDTAPTIEIVQCKDCIHCADDWNGNEPQFTCELGRCTESVYPNDYCSCGERIDK